MTEAEFVPTKPEEIGKLTPLEEDARKRLLEILNEAKSGVKHGDHDQSDHGNWATGGSAVEGELLTAVVGDEPTFGNLVDMVEGRSIIGMVPDTPGTNLERIQVQGSGGEKEPLDAPAAHANLTGHLSEAGFTSGDGESFVNQFGERVTVTEAGDTTLIVNQYEFGTDRLTVSERLTNAEDLENSQIFNRLIIEQIMNAELTDQPLIIKARAHFAMLSWLHIKHGDHDQSDHGNWATGGGGDDVREATLAERAELVGEAVLAEAAAKAEAHAFPDQDPRNGNPQLAVANATAHELANRYVTEGRTTQEIYEHNEPPGAYTFGREELHEEIMETFRARDADVPNDREAVIVGGIFGAGKGYSQESMGEDKLGFDPDQFAVVNPDEFKTELIENDPIDFQGLKEGEQAALFHEESSDMAKNYFQDLTADGKNVIFDYSMGSEKSLDQRLEALHAAGYDVKMVFVDTAPEDAARNAVERWNNPEDGRWVDLEHYQAVRDQIATHPDGFTNNREVFENGKEKVESWVLIGGTSRGHGEPQLLGSGGK